MEIVSRCKDCKYFHEIKHGKGLFYCEFNKDFYLVHKKEINRLRICLKYEQKLKEVN